MSQSSARVVGIFDDPRRAERAIADLKAAGFEQAAAMTHGPRGRRGRTEVSVRAGGREGLAASLLERGGGRVETPIGEAVSRATGLKPAPGKHALELVAEQPVAVREPQTAGEVQVAKDVVLERRRFEVPLADEEVVVRLVAREPVDGPAGHAFGAGELRVVVTREEAALERVSLVSDELVAERHTVEQPVRVRTNVRREVPVLHRLGHARARAPRR